MLNGHTTAGGERPAVAMQTHPVRSANPHHQKMSVVELRDAVTALVAARTTFSLQSMLASNVEVIRHLDEWAEGHRDALDFEIEDMVLELESRRGLGEDDEHDRNIAIAYAYPVIRNFGRFDLNIGRRGGAQ